MTATMIQCILVAIPLIMIYLISRKISQKEKFIRWTIYVNLALTAYYAVLLALTMFMGFFQIIYIAGVDVHMEMQMFLVTYFFFMIIFWLVSIVAILISLIRKAAK